MRADPRDSYTLNRWRLIHLKRRRDEHLLIASTEVTLFRTLFYVNFLTSDNISETRYNRDNKHLILGLLGPPFVRVLSLWRRYKELVETNDSFYGTTLRLSLLIN